MNWDQTLLLRMNRGLVHPVLDCIMAAITYTTMPVVALLLAILWLHGHSPGIALPYALEEMPLGRLSGSGGWIRASDLRAMSSSPVSVPTDRQTVQLS